MHGSHHHTKASLPNSTSIFLLLGKALFIAGKSKTEAALSWATWNDLLFSFTSILLQLEDRFIYVSWYKTHGFGSQELAGLSPLGDAHGLFHLLLLFLEAAARACPRCRDLVGKKPET